VSAVGWIEDRSGFVLRPWQRAVVEAMFPADGSPSRWETFLISTVKKAGKTSLTGWCALYAALTHPPGETCFVIGHDIGQSDENLFSLIVAAVRAAGLEQSGAATIRTDRIVFENGTRIIALPSDFAGAAGARFGVTAWTELWGFRHEGHIRLWEELTPIPNRRSLRIVDSYAGFTGDAPVLEPLWARALAGERLDDELPIYANGRLWALLDQGVDAQERGWLGDPRFLTNYYEEQRASLRPGTFARLHLNQWQQGEETFVTAEMYDACVRPELRPVVSDPGLQVFAGVDAATRRDCAAVVAVARVMEGDRVAYRLIRHRIWTVGRGETLDLEDTIEAFVLDLQRLFQLRLVCYDPSQMVRSAQTLSKQGVRMEPYNQTSGNLTLAGQNLYDLLNSHQLELYGDAELRRHFLNAVAVSSGRGWRLAKEKTTNKIDGCVATSFAALAAVQQPIGSLGAPMFGATPERSRHDIDGTYAGPRPVLVAPVQQIEPEAYEDEEPPDYYLKAYGSPELARSAWNTHRRRELKRALLESQQTAAFGVPARPSRWRLDGPDGAR
jgi:phage terminase large subunit-like protein